jgi:regulator of PEP synthase PpsR (kinase-PPPase family)
MSELFSTPARVTPLRQGPPIYVVSGSTGATGELLARTVLAQFPDVHVPLEIERRVITAEQIRTIIARAAEHPGAIILHTMVNQTFRHLLIEEASVAGVMTFDLSGPLQEHLSLELDMPPLGQPGRFHQINRAYFDRVQAIEFTVSHDDGQRVDDLAQAEIILLGVSRVGKTPLSMYLSVMGWKVANVPLTPPVPPPAELLAHRRARAQRTGIPEGDYMKLQAIVEEQREVTHFFYRHGFAVVDTTDKPIESSAEEITALVTRRLIDLPPAAA